MKTFKCEEMMCDHCVSRMKQALGEAGIKHSVDLKTKTVTIDDTDTQTLKAAELLDDLGYSVSEID